MNRQDCEMTKLCDHALLERIAAGDDHAFEYLVQHYHTPLHLFASKRLKDHELAYDVVQFAFLQLYLYIPKLSTRLSTVHTPSPLKSWLFQVASNRCRDELRKRRPVFFSELDALDEEGEERAPVAHSIEDPCPLPEEVAEQEEVRRMLWREIEKLPPKLQAVVFLRYLKGLRFGEIGRLLQMPENTAKTYFLRARLLLRDALKASGTDRAI